MKTNDPIRIQNLTKRFKTVTALDDVTLSLKKGRIYGLVGNNGAGKTTLMRILAGLSFPTSGSVELLGETTPKGLEAARRKTGFLIEGPVGYDGMTPRQNLIAQSMLYGKPDKDYIDELIELVGLEQTTATRTLYRVCSLGQKQRYSLAFALLNRPELLVLDEPTNGLDPAGMRELRELLLRLNREQGVTMLISSHLLGHLYQTASDFLFLDRGRVIAQRSHSRIEEEWGDRPDLEEYFFGLLQKERDRA